MGGWVENRGRTSVCVCGGGEAGMESYCAHEAKLKCCHLKPLPHPHDIVMTMIQGFSPETDPNETFPSNLRFVTRL